MLLYVFYSDDVRDKGFTVILDMRGSIFNLDHIYNMFCNVRDLITMPFNFYNGKLDLDIPVILKIRP
jgi:hypothetical protein